ncbi:50S ribosomal protein L15 [Spirochaetes bacterium]|uniref:Large ribosomal subunit protein uL15 n=1 Tax=Candidatus Scatousia excrementipullorum TaxID=2840936 RepID=A0A9D9DR70_9BACT|nr:50S ribosomal protein L15 [Candidatus Scatousia excrementipullorum]
MTLEDLRPAEGSTHKSKRVGRGRSSGHGKTSCRGHNGEGQRSGSASKRGFEGGQMPAYRRLPKLKGFQIINKIKYAEVNVARLDTYKLKEVSLESLIEAKRIHPSSEGLRIMGNGEIKTAVNVKANYVTPAAKAKIEAAGGKVELV